MFYGRKILCVVFMFPFMAHLASAGVEKSQASEQMKFNKLPTYYTGRIFPTPQKVEYSDKSFSLTSSAIIPGKNLKKDDLRVRFLKDRIEMNGGKVEITDADSKLEKYDTIIYLNAEDRGIPPPEKPQGYSISCSTADGNNIIAVNSKDTQGLLWGIASLTQLINAGNKTPVIKCANVSDYPDNEMRGFLSGYWPNTGVEFLFFTKMNSVVFQNALCNDREASFRNKEWLDGERIKSMKLFGAMAKECDLNIYYSIGSHSLFVPKHKNGMPLTCSSEEDFKIVYDITCLLAENNCGLYLAFDDVRFAGVLGESRLTSIPPEDLKRFGSARESDIYFVNRLYREVKNKYPDFKMVFCPPFYWGPTSPAPYPENREEYLAAVGKRLDKGIDVFWTGPRVKFAPITQKEVDWITSLIDRKPILARNGKGTPHIYMYSFITDPIIWDDKTYEGFYHDMKAVFINSMGYSDTSSTATLGDYTWNTKAYVPAESVKTVVEMFFGPEAFGIFDNLNKKLSYFDVYGLRVSPAAAMKLDELEAKFKEVMEAYSIAEKYNKFALENLSGMKRFLTITDGFINRLKKNPNLKAFAEADEKVKADAVKEANFKKGDILLTPNNFIGGGGPSSYGNSCPSRFTTWIYGNKTVNSFMRADFECDPFPPSGDYTLIVSGQDDDAEKECNIEIKINDKILFSGPSGFVKNGWSIRKFNVPAACLQRYNKLTIANIEDSDIRTGPPFFMLNYAVLKKTTD